MMDTAPEPIKDYYIAYMDLLGYKQFFVENPDKAQEFLSYIHDAIQKTKEHLCITKISPILSAYANMDIKIKVFSDNILICVSCEEHDPADQLRLLCFVKLISEIQRGFITQYGLFLRGGLTKGKLSFHNEYVFGQGLIAAVTMEESATYPRIIVDEALISYMKEVRVYKQNDIEKAAEIARKMAENEAATEDEKQFFMQVNCNVFMHNYQVQEMNQLVSCWRDGYYYLCYLYYGRADDPRYKDLLDHVLPGFKDMFPVDYEIVMRRHIGLADMMKAHKEKVESKLKRYGNYNDCTTDQEVKQRENVMQKYIWSMAYHNLACTANGTPEYTILTKANFDARFVKPTIEVITDDQSPQKQ